MHFQFLIEDQSGQILIEQLMQKVQSEHPDITCNYKAFRGIGGFTKKNTVKETKDGKLLNDLSTYLAGFDRSLKHIDAAVFIIVDNDDRDTASFRNELESVAKSRNITVDHVFCIAVEEIEAWLLGDQSALLKAYPQAITSRLRSYVQDKICGTWEILADAIYPGGISKMKKDNPAYTGIGQKKCEWAREIGKYMDLHNNKSPSFNYFVTEEQKRAGKAL